MEGDTMGWRRAIVAAVLVVGGTGSIAAAQASASTVPRAELSINPAKGALTVTFVAKATGFPSPVVSYVWKFGDGHTAMTSTRTVSHTYPSAARFTASVTETDANADSATAAGALKLTQCTLGNTSCSESLEGASNVSLLKVRGPTSPSTPAGVKLFVAPFQIANCEPQLSPAAAFTDTGFTGTLTITLSYTTSHPGQVATTCFASTVPFVDAADQTVTSGPLPRCNTRGAAPPCVVSITTGTPVTKVLRVPAGDPKVGAP
jgi:PKD domain